MSRYYDTQLFDNNDERIEYDHWLMSQLYNQHKELSRLMGHDHVKFLRSARKASFRNKIIKFVEALRK